MDPKCDHSYSKFGQENGFKSQTTIPTTSIVSEGIHYEQTDLWSVITSNNFLPDRPQRLQEQSWMTIHKLQTLPQLTSSSRSSGTSFILLELHCRLTGKQLNCERLNVMWPSRSAWPLRLSAHGVRRGTEECLLLSLELRGRVNRSANRPETSFNNQISGCVCGSCPHGERHRGLHKMMFRVRKLNKYRNLTDGTDSQSEPNDTDFSWPITFFLLN